jgi:hypothetical protein
MLSKQALEHLYLAIVNRLSDGDGQRIVCLKIGHVEWRVAQKGEIVNWELVISEISCHPIDFASLGVLAR